MKDSATELKHRLRSIGISDPAIEAAWPAWWSDEADTSLSARAELRYSLSRKLGLDPRSLIDDGEPRFVWRDDARFKHLSSEGPFERAAITSFGKAVSGALLAAYSAQQTSIVGISASELRAAILQNQPFIRLTDLLSIAWSLGIPVVHLRVFPLPQKRLAAMAVRVDKRNAILLGRDSNYPAYLTFHLAHELGHIALGHLESLGKESVIVDLDAEDGRDLSDPEEEAADAFALELLTGEPNPDIRSTGVKVPSAKSLAKTVIAASRTYRIEPGTLALCYAHRTGQWSIANAALPVIYGAPIPVWTSVNKIALNQLQLGGLPEDSEDYIRIILGRELT